MQTVSFKIGDEKKRDLKDIASIYKETISSSGTTMGMYNREARSLATLKNTNINFGNEKKVDYVSEAKEKFMRQAHTALGYHRQQRPPNNVTLQETSANYFETVKNIDFNYKGEARFIRSRIPNEVRADQRASHFKVGFENQNPFASQNLSLQPTNIGDKRPSSAAIPIGTQNTLAQAPQQAFRNSGNAQQLKTQKIP